MFFPSLVWYLYTCSLVIGYVLYFAKTLYKNKYFIENKIIVTFKVDFKNFYDLLWPGYLGKYVFTLIENNLKISILPDRKSTDFYKKVYI